MLDFLFGPPRRHLADSADPMFGDLGLYGTSFYGRSRTQAGVMVSEELSLTHAVVWRCTTLLSGAISNLPLEMFRRTASNDREPAVGRPEPSILNICPNETMGATVFREGRIAHQLLWGQGFGEILRSRPTKTNPLGSVGELHPIHPSRVRPARPGERPELPNAAYMVRGNDNTELPMLASEILHVPGKLSEDGIWAKGVVPYARESIGMGLAVERHGATTFGAGAVPRVAVSGLGFKDKDARAAFRKEWRELHGHPDSGEIAIIPQNAEMKPITLPAEANQYIQTRQYNTVVICQWFDVPPHMAGAMQGGAGARTVEQEGAEFVIYSLVPLTRRWEEQLALKLLSPEEREEFYFSHNFNSLLRGDIQARMNAYKTAISTGVMTINECRRLENMNGIGEAGDQNFVPLNMTTAEKLMQAPMPQPGKGLGSDQSGSPADGGTADGVFTLADFDRWTKTLSHADRKLLSGQLTRLQRDKREPGLLPIPGQKLCEEEESNAELLDLPDVRQEDGFSCGAAAAMTVGKYFGVGPADLAGWKRALGTDKKNGTHPQAIIDYLRSLGLTIEARPGMTVEDLEEEWEECCPVICPVQDSAEAANRNGHYVVVRGIGLGAVFVQDPASGRREIEEDDWVAGWHDREADGTAYEQFGIVVNPPDEDDEEESPQISAAAREAARAVLLDTLSRMLTKEANAAERASRGDFDQWLAEFYPKHQVTVAKALEPACAVLSAAGIPALAQGIAGNLAVRSVSLLRAAYDADTREQFAAKLAKWPTERAKEEADGIMACGGPGSGVPGPCAEEHDAEGDRIDAERDAEDAQVDAKHEAEDKAAEDARAKEDDETTDRHSDEKDAHDAEREKAGEALDKAQGKEKEALEKSQEKEVPALEKQHDKENDKADSANEKEEAKVSAAREKEDDKIQGQRDKEDEKLSDARDKEDEKLSDARDAHDEKHAPEDADSPEGTAYWDKTLADRKKEDKDVDDRRATEDKAIEERRQKEDEEKDARRETEDGVREEAQTKEAKDRESRQEKEKEDLEAKHERERDALDEKHDAEQKAHDKAWDDKEAALDAKHQAEIDAQQKQRDKEDSDRLDRQVAEKDAIEKRRDEEDKKRKAHVLSPRKRTGILRCTCKLLCGGEGSGVPGPCPVHGDGKADDAKEDAGQKPPKAPKEGFKKTQDAEAFAREHLVSGDVSMKGIKPDVAGGVVSHLADRMAEVPALDGVKLDQMQSLGVRKAVMGLYQDTRNGDNAVLVIPKGMDDREKFGNFWDVSKQYADKKGSPWSTASYFPREKAMESTVDHELGHLIELKTMTSANKAAWEKTFDGVGHEAWSKVSQIAPLKAAGPGYMRGAEAFAESVALHLNGKSDLIPEAARGFVADMVGRGRSK